MLFESTWVYFEYTKLTLYTNTNTIATQTLTLKLFSESIKLKEKKNCPKYQIKQVKFVFILLRNITITS